ncbi:hypothetical protein AAF712_011485 [Marasmius tenuissimus]|uniref:aldehyde dehydrogenase (NAD(+)) n=1 Tax=Marasmius tenuissimus TaxID=585030 RepID=A0ABR2ZL49_9AGAR
MFLTNRALSFSSRGYILRRSLSSRASGVLSALNIPTSGEIHGVYDGQWGGSGEIMESVCPTTGEVLARVKTVRIRHDVETRVDDEQGRLCNQGTPEETELALQKTREAYASFRNLPAPRRGDILRQIRSALSDKREELGALVSLEMGKIKTEGIGEVQEFIDICDYAVGLSRMMNGRVVASERPGHTILEVPNPLGVVAVLSAFNFPVAVYGWNLALSLAAGNATIWKPSPTTPLCSIAVTSIIAEVLKKNDLPGAVAGLVTGGKNVGETLVNSHDVELVSFTGSERVGSIVGQAVASRFGKVILELGGNNASIVMPDADMSLAIPGVFFGSVGTAGQRCTSTRRLFLHRDIATEFLEKLRKLYTSIKPGDPLTADTLLGPMHNKAAVSVYDGTVEHLHSINAEVLCGGKKFDEAPFNAGNFVKPTIAVPKSVDMKDKIWSTETFAPILNAAVFDELEQAIEWNNAVPQVCRFPSLRRATKAEDTVVFITS